MNWGAKAIRRSWLLLVVTGIAGCGPSSPATVEMAQTELERVLAVWVSGEFKINPSARRKEMRGVFESMMGKEVLESYRIVSGEATEKPGEFLFKTTLICRPLMGSVTNPGSNRPREVPRSYYVYRPGRRWVVESGEMRAFQEGILGK